MGLNAIAVTAQPPLFKGPEVLSSASDKVKLFGKNLMTQVSLNFFLF